MAGTAQYSRVLYNTDTDSWVQYSRVLYNTDTDCWVLYNTETDTNLRKDEMIDWLLAPNLESERSCKEKLMGMLQYSAVQYSKVQYNTMSDSSTIQYSTNRRRDELTDWKLPPKMEAGQSKNEKFQNSKVQK